jgi:hypothetical protein
MQHGAAWRYLTLARYYSSCRIVAVHRRLLAIATPEAQPQDQLQYPAGAQRQARRLPLQAATPRLRILDAMTKQTHRLDRVQEMFGEE